MEEHRNIAIDGPAGAGKSTVAKAIARELGMQYLDTGAMYRALALYAVRQGVDPSDEKKVEAILPGGDVRVRFTQMGQRVLIGEEDVSDLIRTQEISMGASLISAHPCVRDRMAAMQRQVGREYDVVMDGRDITTNVLPDTPYKFFVTASPEERARRRCLELKNRGDCAADYAQVLSEINRRDQQDSTRAYMPLRVAQDAVVIDTTGLEVEEVVEQMLNIIRKKATR